MPDESRLFLDHRGRIRERPAQQPPIHRTGIHGMLVCDGAVLLTRPPGGDWLELPGGGIETGEDVERALSRELREEAGIHLRPTDVAAGENARLATRYYAANHDAYWLYDQRFRLIRFHQRPALFAPEERGHEPRWIALGELHTWPVHHLHRLGVERLLGLHT